MIPGRAVYDHQGYLGSACWVRSDIKAVHAYTLVADRIDEQFVFSNITKLGTLCRSPVNVCIVGYGVNVSPRKSEMICFLPTLTSGHGRLGEIIVCTRHIDRWYVVRLSGKIF